MKHLALIGGIVLLTNVLLFCGYMGVYYALRDYYDFVHGDMIYHTDSKIVRVVLEPANRIDGRIQRWVPFADHFLPD